MDWESLTETIASLSCGAVLGGGVFGAVYCFVPGVFAETVGLEQVVMVGSLLGSASHRLVRYWFINSVIGKSGRKETYYARLAELEDERRRGELTEEEYRVLRSRLKEWYYLERESERFGLPRR